MNFIKLLFIFTIFNLSKSSSFKKSIYGSMVSMKFKLALDVLKRNTKVLNIYDLASYKNILNEN